MAKVTVEDEGFGGGLGKVSLWLNLILLIGIIGLYIYFQSKPPPEPDIVETVTTVTQVDTIWVDRIERELLVQHDTVYAAQPVPPGFIGLPPLKTYVRSYSDTLITARVETTVNGIMTDQRFFYTPFISHIVVTTDNTSVIIHEKPTYIKRQFIQAGLETGLIGGKLQVNPMVGFTSKNGTTTYYRYSPWDNGHTIGFLTPIRFPKFNIPWK